MRVRRWVPVVLGAALVVIVPERAVGAAWAGGAAAPATVAATPAAPAAPAAPATVAAAPAAPSPSDEAAFVSRINSLRASHGLSQLQVSGELTSVARAWTERMVSAGQISHNPDLGNQVRSPWLKLGENVGVGQSVDSLMQSFMDSPSHHRNLVDPEWNFVGVGVTIAPDGRMYTTHNFMRLDQGPPPTEPPPPPPPPPAPEPTPAPPPAPAPAAPRPAPPAGPPDPEPPGDEPAAVGPSAERVASVLAPLRAIEP